MSESVTGRKDYGAARRGVLSGAMKSDAERGPFGAWLVRQRKARSGSGRDGSMTAHEVRAAVQRSAGYGISPSVYAELEAGTRHPSDDVRLTLEAWAGEESPRRRDVDLSEVVAALDRLRTAIEVQTATLTQDMVPVSAVREVMQSLFDAELLLSPPDRPANTDRPHPDQP